MHRIGLIALLLAGVASGVAGFAQESSSNAGAHPSGVTPDTSAEAEPQSAGAEVTAAEAAMASSDWKTAEAKLEPWLATHPQDGRALFDAGYVADSEKRPDDAAGLYRRAIAANPKSFEAHISLGLLLARQGKPAEARPELEAATKLDPGEAGPGLKARAWRALAQIDRSGAEGGGDATEAANDLLEALKLSPETPSDILLSASLAEDSGAYDEAEAAYRRALAQDAQSEPANAGLAHLLIRKKEYPEAETLLRAALVKLPDDPALTAQLATVLAAEDKAEALPLLQKLHAEHPADPAITNMLASVLSDAGDAAGSDQLYVKLLEADAGESRSAVGPWPESGAAGQVRRGAGSVRQGDPAGPGQHRRLERTGFCGIENQPARRHAARAYDAVKVSSGERIYLLSVGDILRYVARKTAAAVYYHHFLDAAAGKFPNQEWQARQRLHLLEK